MSDRNPLELEVANFGPIAEAKIDLRPLTVFVGPSNTGKSYLAVLIYALHRFFGGGGRFEGGFPFPYDILDHKKHKLSKNELNDLRKWAEESLRSPKKAAYDNGILLPDPVAGLVRSSLTGINSMGPLLGGEINRCFGISNIRTLIREGKRSGAHVVIRRNVPDDSRPFVHTLTITGSDVDLSTVIPEQIPIRLQRASRPGFLSNLNSLRKFVRDFLSSRTGQDRQGLESDIWYLIQHLSSFAKRHVVGSLDSPAFYLPADRTGVMHAHTVVVNALIRSAAMTGLRSASAPTSTLSGVLADFLEQLIDFSNQPLERYQPRNGRNADLGSRIEEKVLRGSVHIKKSEFGYPFFTYKPKDWRGEDLPLMNASSMVSELAPVVLYLRHIVRRENVLIVEEPESHLHPAMQVEFTRQLAAVVRSGVRVIVTTHSEWLLEELANLVQLSGLSSSNRGGIKYGDEALSPNDVGVWLFEPKNRPKGSFVKEIPLNESGLFPSGFSAVASALHNDWAEISSRIGKSH